MSFGIPVRNGLSIGLLASTFLTSGSGRLVPRLTLNFLTGGPLDPRITFSRTTNATLVDATGRVTYAPNNLFTNSEVFENAAWVKANSTVTANATVAPDGTTTADKLVENTATGAHQITQQTAFVSGTSYTWSFYVKAAERSVVRVLFPAAAFTSNLTANFDLATGAWRTGSPTPSPALTLASQDAGNGWYRISATATATASLNQTILLLMVNTPSGTGNYTGDGTSGLFIWGAQLEQVTYQTLPSTYVQTVASAYYGPRFDYDPVTLAPRGLLIEEQRTNLLLYSDQFDNAGWLKSNATVTANATTSPDGTANADKLVEDSSNTSHFIRQNATGVIGTAYTSTLFLKAAERTAAVVVHFDGAAFCGVSINLLTGALSTPPADLTLTDASATSSVQAFGNGWYRVTVTRTQVTSTTLQSRVFTQSGSNGVYTGNGTSGIFLYGAQLEAGSFATSYIPTVASTVTRAADNATMTGTNFSSWFNASEGTFVASAAVLSTASNRGVYAASDGSGVNELFHYVSTTANNLVTTASVAQANVIISGPVSINTVFSDAFAYRENDISAAFNGVLGTPDTSATLPVVSQLRLGARGDAALRLNGHLRTLTYYATRLTNAQLQALSA